ncbi:2-hydroxyacid dehydrogenase [Denitrobaculum tricleocarpae]|uniref:2-hydroxyacid dehydrogenase n=1 Tax=Denitrobaculum tricleocarpae TaxID=2591009 RepID=A0A545TWM9_9PROT|nr:2-hydroxyacid dehydrogenase [Denitrobaculum tricleocarpae]TQV81620.1 2-hydroxyacid dehydrogenase [Denitrobaculum tricleocarpae]
MKPEIVVLSRLGPPEVMEALEASYQLHCLWEASDWRAALMAASSARGLVTTGSLGADAALIDALPALEVISINGVGLDAVDLPAAKARGIAIGYTPGVLTEGVADMAVALILAASRKLVQGDRFVRDGTWAGGEKLALGWSIRGKVVGFLGFGRIGREVARLLSVFGISALYHEPEALEGVAADYCSDLAAMAEASDVVVVCCAGGAATRNLVDASVLKALGSKGLLVNIARGSVVCEPDLIAALQAGHLGGAALDVFADEPQIPAALQVMENVVLTPHIASGTAETRLAMGRLVVENLAAYFSGKPLLTPAPMDGL